MRGEAHVQRGSEIRYYRCPNCGARRCPAELVEQEVLAAIAEAVLPASVIDAARSPVGDWLSRGRSYRAASGSDY